MPSDLPNAPGHSMPAESHLDSAGCCASAEYWKDYSEKREAFWIKHNQNMNEELDAESELNDRLYLKTKEIESMYKLGDIYGAFIKLMEISREREYPPVQNLTLGKPKGTQVRGITNPHINN